MKLNLTLNLFFLIFTSFREVKMKRFGSRKKYVLKVNLPKWLENFLIIF